MKPNHYVKKGQSRRIENVTSDKQHEIHTVRTNQTPDLLVRSFWTASGATIGGDLCYLHLRLHIHTDWRFANMLN